MHVAAQGEFNPSGHVLQDIPAKYIYEPWKAPIAVQRTAGCVIGKDYPKPIVDHAVVYQTNIQRHKAAYENQAANGSATVPSKRKSPATGRKAPRPSKTPKITSFMKP